MAELRFLPSSRRAWSAHRSGDRTAHVSGWADIGDSIMKDASLARWLSAQLDMGTPFADVLKSLNGNFAIAIEAPGELHLGVDAIRSIPLFYRKEAELIVASDELGQLRHGDEPMDESSAMEYSTAGYVTGPHTLFQGIRGLQSGEHLSQARGDSGPISGRYFAYLPSYDAEGPAEAHFDALDSALLKAFGSVIESLDGRQALLPLSGGLDSRLVAWMFKRCGYDNLRCFSYGLPGNLQAVRARGVAEVLGYPWMAVSYSGRMWKEALESADLRSYWSFSANGVSVPHCDDWPAVKELRQRPDVSTDAVFVPGHTGDFISGSHLKYLFDPAWNDDPRAFDDAMISKHFSMWEDLARIPTVRNAIGSRLKESLGELGDETDEDFARRYEYWEWQERQAKLIINSVRAYEFFGFSWRVPLWDRALMDFWSGVPIALKMDGYLYRSYLASCGPEGLFSMDAPAQPWSRDAVLRSQRLGPKRRAKAAIRRFKPLRAALDGYDQRSRYFREYRNHPLGLARAYGAFGYVLRKPSKRHALSLLLEQFLREEYGLDISELKSRYASDPPSPKGSVINAKELSALK